MANPAVANVLAGKPLVTGGIARAPLGTALPTTAVMALNAAFLKLGYAGEDGLTEGTDRSTEKVKAWGGDIVKVLQTDFSVTYSFTLIESLNTDVLKAIYGQSDVTVTAATASTGTLRTVLINSTQLEHGSWVFDMKDGLALVRVAVPDGQITEVGEITYSDGEIIAYPVTVEAFKDASGNQAYKYLDDGVFV